MFAIVAGIGLIAAVIAGIEVSNVVLILIPLVILGGSIDHSSSSGQPHGAESLQTPRTITRSSSGSVVPLPVLRQDAKGYTPGHDLRHRNSAPFG
jgi:hypothetical protein